MAVRQEIGNETENTIHDAHGILVLRRAEVRASQTQAPVTTHTMSSHPVPALIDDFNLAVEEKMESVPASEVEPALTKNNQPTSTEASDINPFEGVHTATPTEQGPSPSMKLGSVPPPLLTLS